MKNRISARDMVADVRAGLDDSTLMAKYRLTSQGLKRALDKLVEAGALTARDLAAMKNKPDESSVIARGMGDKISARERLKPDLRTPTRRTETTRARTFFVVAAIFLIPIAVLAFVVISARHYKPYATPSLESAEVANIRRHLDQQKSLLATELASAERDLRDATTKKGILERDMFPEGKANMDDLQVIISKINHPATKAYEKLQKQVRYLEHRVAVCRGQVEENAGLLSDLTAGTDEAKENALLTAKRKIAVSQIIQETK